MEPVSLLASLGLSKNEAKTYLALLRTGSTPAGPLIKELGMHRAAVYNLLDLLLDKGLVHYVIQANRKYFEAEHPRRLKEFIDAQRKRLDTKELTLEQHIPQLEAFRQLSQESQEGTVYKGKKGLTSVFEDILQYKGEEFCVMGASGKFKEILHAYFTHWQTRRFQQEIPLRIIYAQSVKAQHREKELKLAAVRYTSDMQFTPATTLMYADKVAIVVWSEVPFAFVIRSKTVSDSYKKYFEQLWGMAQSSS